MAPPVNPKEAFGDLKPKLHLVPETLVVYAARAMQEGLKYGPYNWRESAVCASTYVSAVRRHLAAWWDGEETDPESATAKHHLGGAAASLAILIDALECGTLLDDRPQPGPTPRMFRKPGFEREAFEAAVQAEVTGAAECDKCGHRLAQHSVYGCHEVVHSDVVCSCNHTYGEGGGI